MSRLQFPFYSSNSAPEEMATHSIPLPSYQPPSQPAWLEAPTVRKLGPDDTDFDLEAQEPEKPPPPPYTDTLGADGAQPQRLHRIRSLADVEGDFSFSSYTASLYEVWKGFCGGLRDFAGFSSTDIPQCQVPPPKRGEESEERPRLPGRFLGIWDTIPDTASEIFHDATYFKYHVISLHFPVEHHYQRPGAEPPWMARVILFFHSLTDFTNYNFLWRNNLHKRYRRSTMIDWDSHPTLRGVAMFASVFTLEFSASYRRHWRAEVTVWSRDPAQIDDDPSDFEIPRLISKETSVCTEAMRVDDSPISTIPLCPRRRRVFIRYPEQPHQPAVDGERAKDTAAETSGDFCIARTKTLDVDEPELRKILEDNLDRQLFGEEQDIEDIEQHPPGCNTQ